MMLFFRTYICLKPEMPHQFEPESVPCVFVGSDERPVGAAVERPSVRHVFGQRCVEVARYGKMLAEIVAYASDNAQ